MKVRATRNFPSSQGTYSRIFLRTRRFVTLEFDLDDQTANINWSTVGDDIKDAVVRVKIKATEVYSSILDPIDIRKMLLSRIDKPYYVYPVSVEIIRASQSNFVEQQDNIFGSPREEFSRFVKMKNPANLIVVESIADELFMEIGL